MRRSLPWILTAFLAAGLCTASQAALPRSGVSRTHHLWGRCAAGAWKLVQVITETLDDQGQVTQSSTSETKTTLAQIDDDGVTLEVRTAVQLAGRRFDSPPQVFKQGYHGDLVGTDLKIKDLGTSELVIGQEKIPCRVEETEAITTSGRTVATTYYSDSVAPYILKRASLTTDPEGREKLSETTMEVVAVNVPYQILSTVLCTAQVKTVHKHPGGTTSTLAVVSPNVPGGVVTHTSKEMDNSGRLIRRSTLKLVNFSAEAEEERPGLFGFGRRRAARLRKPPPVTPVQPEQP